MHAWSSFVQGYLDERGLKAADLSRRSGVSPQVLSNILTDPRESLDRRPDQRTISKLATAMGLPENVLLAKVGEAMGLPVAETVVVYDASRVPNDELIRELSSRLREEVVGDASQRAAAPTIDVSWADPREEHSAAVPGLADMADAPRPTPTPAPGNGPRPGPKVVPRGTGHGARSRGTRPSANS